MLCLKDAAKSLPGAQAVQPHQPAILSWRQDRHRRAQRRRQVNADQDHGRPRQGFHRRGVAGRERHGRLPAAGAAARSLEDGARERQGRRPRRCRHGRSLQRHLGRNGRSQGRHRLRQADGGDGRAPGQDRRGRRWTLDNQLEVAMEACAARRDSPVPTCRAARNAASR